MKKFSPMRFTAATEEAAVQGALQLVGASPEEADYEVLDQSAKGVTVRVKPKDLNAPTPVVAEATQPEPVAPEPVAQAEEVEPETEIEAQVEEISAPAATTEEFEADSQSDEEYAAETEANYDAEDEEYDDADEAQEESGDDDEADSEPEAELVETTSASPESISRAHGLAQEILDRMGLNATCQPLDSENDKSIALVIEGDDIGILIGKQGATLQSFQYILNLSFNNGAAPEEGMRITVDAGNYRARRQSSLEMTARTAAQRARTSGRPVRLDPMPSSERRIIHMFLQAETGITTQSEGREPQRRLVIFPGDTVTGGGSRYENRGGGGRGMGGFGRSNSGNSRGGRGFRR